MDIKNIDLNLLPALDALLRHRSVSLAARELDMSQSALSAALARLRKLLGDPLFVRTGRGLAPTPRAAALAQPVREILDAVRERVVRGGAFDPAVDSRSFRLLMTDVGAYVLWPRILRALRVEAPACSPSLRVVPPQDIAGELAEGRGDLAIGAFPGLPLSLFQRRLFERRYVCLLSREHPLARGARIGLHEFARAPQVVVRMASGIQDRVDEELARHRLARSDVLEAHSYLTVPPLLESAGYLCVLPGQLADELTRHGPLVARPIPVKTPASTIRMYWHRRMNDDAGHAWLRSLVVAQWANR